MQITLSTRQPNYQEVNLNKDKYRPPGDNANRSGGVLIGSDWGSTARRGGDGGGSPRHGAARSAVPQRGALIRSLDLHRP